MHIDYDLIDSDPTPFGELSLYRYRTEAGENGYEIRINDNFLMASHGALGEVVMVDAALDHLAKQREIRVLVGGLGAGHTLRRVLDVEGVCDVVVAEIGTKVVKWNRRYFAETNGRAVYDERVRIEIDDVAAVIARKSEAFDLMLLDVDNGPGWLAAEGNATLYTERGLAACRKALAHGGVLAVWSPSPNPTFAATLPKVFPNHACVTSTDLDPQAGPTDVVYLGVR